MRVKTTLKKTEHIFILGAVLIAAVLLAGTGFFYYMRIADAEPNERFLQYLLGLCFPAMPVLVLAGGIWMLRCASQIQKKLEAWDGNDWEEVEETDLKIETGLFLAQFFDYAAFIIFMVCAVVYRAQWEESFTLRSFAICAACYWLPHILTAKAFNRLKKSSRRLHPERKHSADEIYDAHTMSEIGGVKAWMEESDEGEKQLVYEAAYKAYKRGNYFSVSLLFAAGVLSVSYLGLLAVFAVAAVFWFLMNVTFYYERNRLRRQGIRE